MILIFLAVVATNYTEGMWSNAINLVNVVTAALLAVNFFEPLARTLDGWQPTFTYVCDFISIWALFCVFMLIFRLLTDSISRVKVRFLKIADRIGSGILSALLAWVVVCFAMMTLHTAPMSRTFLFDGFQPKEKMVLGMAPDRQWLGFAKGRSEGVYSRMEERPFDPGSKFISTYEQRRSDIEVHIESTNKLRVNK